MTLLIVCYEIPELYLYQIIQLNFNCGYVLYKTFFYFSPNRFIYQVQWNFSCDCGLLVVSFSPIATTDGWSLKPQPLLKRHTWAIHAANIKFVKDIFLLHQKDSYAKSNEFQLRLWFMCRQLQPNCYNWRLVTQTTAATKMSCLSFTSSLYKTCQRQFLHQIDPYAKSNEFQLWLWFMYSQLQILIHGVYTGPCSAVGNVSDCRSRGREFDPGPVPYFRGDWSWNNFYGHSPPFRWFIQEGLLSVTSESMCTNYWLTACSSLPRKKCG